jgi:methylmalonyl-CoA mutase C-terminal domain/subunit
MNIKRRILLSKTGLDGHDKGVKLVALALRDAGYEVIYLGLRQTAETIVNAAIEENVDFIGLSILSGAHLNFTRKVMDKLAGYGNENLPGVIVGGIIPQKDIVKLKEMGVKHVFPVGTDFQDIIAALDNAS